MITVETLENLNGEISINTKDIITLDSSNNLITGDGKIITITGTSGGGGTTPDPDPDPDPGTDPVLTETQDSTITILPTAIDSMQNNIYEVIQETADPGWSKIKPIIYQNDFSLESSSGGSMMLSKINFAVRSAGYQIVKVLLFNKNISETTPIAFTRVDADTVALASNPSNVIDITSNGFTLITNATYELANILNTDKMPTAGASGWFSLTSNTDGTAKFQATFTTPIEVTNVRIYRCGGSSTTFNGGVDPYDVTFTGNSSDIVTIEVPKVSDADFVGITAFTSGDLGGTGGGTLTPEDKKYNFSFSYSLDGTTFTDVSPLTQVAEQNTTSGLWTFNNTYADIVIDATNQRNFFVKIPDQDIPNLKNLQLKSWYLI